MAREQYLRGVDLEELQKPKDPPPPLTFRQKLENFWYHFKIPTLIGIGVILVAVFLGISIANREKTDYTAVLVVKGTIGEGGRDEFAALLEKYGKDLDGDGKVKVQLIQLAMTDPGDYVELSTIFSGATAMLFCMEPEYYESQIASLESEDLHYFVKLNVTHEGLAENGRYWNWADSDAQASMGGGFPKNIYFGVRAPVGTAVGHQEESSACRELLEALIADTLMAD